jgi:hypothetical protein
MQNVFLTEVTTPRQAANGTRMFFCSDSGCYYGSYASGYIRRGIPTNIPGSNRSHIFYQLNKKSKGTRILIPNEADRLVELDRQSRYYNTCFHP